MPELEFQDSNKRQYGKIPRDFFEKIIYPKLGAKRSEIVTGPRIGVDNCAIKVGSGEVLVATTDPLSYIPELGPVDSAWLSVNLIASDLSTSGFQPQYFIPDFNLPPSFSDSAFEEYWNALSKECESQGIAIVGGHTGRFDGIDSTVIGGGVMFSLGSLRTYLTAEMGRAGDKLIVTKGAAIASTGILSRVFPNTIEAKLGGDLLERGQRYFRKISTVKEALISASVGVRSAGVSAMHDCTEGGVLSGISELAEASLLGARIDRKSILISDETREICELFGIDPFTSLGEGALVISCLPEKTTNLLIALETNGIESSIVGELIEADKPRVLIQDDSGQTSVSLPSSDPYWQAFYEAKKKGWK